MKKVENTLYHNGYIEIVGNNILYIDNYKRIAEYTCDNVRIVCKNKIISISGKKLEIEYYDNNEMKITGVINEIIFD
jgi:sporulation protein YqfC